MISPYSMQGMFSALEQIGSAGSSAFGRLNQYEGLIERAEQCNVSCEQLFSSRYLDEKELNEGQKLWLRNPSNWTVNTASNGVRSYLSDAISYFQDKPDHTATLNGARERACRLANQLDSMTNERDCTIAKNDELNNELTGLKAEFGTVIEQRDRLLTKIKNMEEDCLRKTRYVEYLRGFAPSHVIPACYEDWIQEDDSKI